MAIYRYTLIKYLKAWSTWIIAAITFFILIFITFIAFKNFDPNGPNAARKYAILTIAIVAGATGFLSIFTSVFSGFKSATMFKDEVEDGTFLVMLSKPITRSKLILFKWLALLTMLVSYTLLISISFLLGIVIFDNGYKVADLNYGGVDLSTLRSSGILVALVMWGILTVVALIFSSIALLISTKLSVGTTIGFSIALGVVIPMTSLVGIFTKKPTFNLASNSNASSLDYLSKTLKNNNQKLVEDPKTLYSVGISTGDSDSYRHAYLFDLNFQINYLASYASDQTIPEAARDFAAKTTTFGNASNAPGVGNGSFVEAKDQGYFKDVNGTNKLTLMQKQLIDSLDYTWGQSWELRSKLIGLSSGFFQLMTPNSNVAFPKDITAKTIKDIILPLYYAGNPTSIKPLEDAFSKGIQSFWSTSYKFIQQESLALMIPGADQNSDNIKHQIDLMNLINVLANIAENNKFDFTLAPIPPTKILKSNQKNNSLNLNQFVAANKVKYNNKIDTYLASAEQIKWLSNPLKAISDNVISNSFAEAKLQMSNAPKYSPTPSPTKVANWTQNDAVTYLLNDKDVINNYRKLNILFDNGYTLKRVSYKNYASRQGILIAYVIIAFTLVPLAYLMIRKQDYR